MLKRLLSAIVGVTLLITLCMNVLAAFSDDPSLTETDPQLADSLSPTGEAIIFEALTELSSTASNLISDSADSYVRTAMVTETTMDTGLNLVVDGKTIRSPIQTVVVGGTTYVPIRSIVELLYPAAAVSWSDGQFLAKGSGFTMTATPGAMYMVVNDRYLYVPQGVLYENDSIMAPMRTICYALGADVTRETMTGRVIVTTVGGPLESGESYYDENDVYWMSRIISAESKNQPISGMIAVGTVIMNRVESPQFPDSIYGVIFETNQFQPVQNGGIYASPSWDSVVAAKLVLDGAREAGESVFFNLAGLDCWTSRTKTLVTTIEDHSFYV